MLHNSNSSWAVQSSSVCMLLIVYSEESDGNIIATPQSGTYNLIQTLCRLFRHSVMTQEYTWLV